jgi:hypothetical protein
MCVAWYCRQLWCFCFSRKDCLGRAENENFRDLVAGYLQNRERICSTVISQS